MEYEVMEIVSEIMESMSQGALFYNMKKTRRYHTFEEIVRALHDDDLIVHIPEIS